MTLERYLKPSSNLTYIPLDLRFAPLSEAPSETPVERALVMVPETFVQSHLDPPGPQVPETFVQSHTDPSRPQSWIWSDGSNPSYTYWNTGEPNNGGGDYCVQLLKDSTYKWNDDYCTSPNPFICYKELPLILINQTKTWREALRYCRENHVDLVSVHTEEIQHWVETAVYYASTANVWMGLRHTCTLSFWFWVSGVSICYQNWAPGNGTAVEDCSGGERTGAVQSGSKKWVSLPENQRLNFICIIKEF
ncbi:lithostathine-1-beta-like [Colossoma macropomum]|uniref:lithostathine-1-beta-like n=1 Tax=Colossoma macropomum TaxID=42526 RepID=UPI00186423CF|nr:lithostathine-1-beta-like [Colossoma macropomum]